MWGGPGERKGRRWAGSVRVGLDAENLALGGGCRLSEDDPIKARRWRRSRRRKNRADAGRGKRIGLREMKRARCPSPVTGAGASSRGLGRAGSPPNPLVKGHDVLVPTKGSWHESIGRGAAILHGRNV